jgi:hypothetical protein
VSARIAAHIEKSAQRMRYEPSLGRSIKFVLKL